MHSSISENNGLAALAGDDQRIYSVGISTGGVAEMRMAEASPARHIIATTIDREGARFAQEQVKVVGLQNQIEIKLEDVAAPLAYPEGYFDFIYARLVLHYLPRNSLKGALGDLYRVLKPRGRLFVVVRSTDCMEAKSKDSVLDPETGMRTYTSNGQSYSRFFHSSESIQDYLASAGFQIMHIKAYPEQLCVDFQRTQPSKQVDAL